MTSHTSISGWIAGAKHGDSTALQKLWEEYFPKLVRLARQRLQAGGRRVADEEDVAISVFESFFRAAEAGRFPNLADRDDLWRLLLRMTVRKATDLHRHQQRAKHGGGAVRGESALDCGDERGVGQIVGAEPTPEMAAQMVEELERLLALLGDKDLARIASAKLEGYENREIAQQIGCSERTIERRLELIRRKWSRDEDET